MDKIDAVCDISDTIFSPRNQSYPFVFSDVNCKSVEDYFTIRRKMNQYRREKHVKNVVRARIRSHEELKTQLIKIFAPLIVGSSNLRIGPIMMEYRRELLLDEIQKNPMFLNTHLSEYNNKV